MPSSVESHRGFLLIPHPSSLTPDGLKIAHASVGEGTPILLLHGWGANIELVWPLAESLAKQGFKVYALDLPGFGNSAPPPTAWTVHDYAALVIAFMDVQGLGRVCLFGHSFGGRISIVLGARYAERFSKIVLCDAAGVKPPTPLRRVILGKLYDTAARWIKPGNPLYGLLERVRLAYRQRAGSSDYLNAGALTETFVAVIEEDLLPFAPQIQRPTLLIWGENDLDTPLWMAHALEKAIPDAGLVVMKGAGHYAYLDALADVTRVMTYFFQNES